MSAADYYHAWTLTTPPSSPLGPSNPPLQELKLPAYRALSPQIGMRRYFADLLAILSNRYQLCPTARHLAVYLLDLFMDHYDVAIKQLYVIALSCLLLASESRPRRSVSLPPWTGSFWGGWFVWWADLPVRVPVEPRCWQGWGSFGGTAPWLWTGRVLKKRVWFSKLSCDPF